MLQPSARQEEMAKPIDDSEKIIRAIRNLLPGTTLILKGDFIAGNIEIANKSDISIIVDGNLTSKYEKLKSLKRDIYPSNYPLFNIINANNLHFSGKYLKSKFYEAFLVRNSSNVSFRVEVDGGGFETDYDGIYLNNCVHCVVDKSVIHNISHLSSNNRHEGHGIAVYASKETKITNNFIEHNGGNGVYIGSANSTLISSNNINNNGLSGIQINFNINNSPTKYFTIEKNFINDNLADGVDCNNTTSPYHVYGKVIGNHFNRNGWLSNKPTKDGSGVGTYINIKDIEVVENISEDSAQTGAYFSGSSNFLLARNTISKSPLSLGNGIYIENSQQGLIIDNSITWGLGMETFKIFGFTKDIRVESNTIYGELVIVASSNQSLSHTNLYFLNNKYTSNMPFSSPYATFSNNTPSQNQ